MPALCLRRCGMRLEQFRESDGCVEAKLVGIQGHWEDGASFMWSTEMKRLGLEPFQDDPEWNKLFDSQGNRLFGTRKSCITGIWLKWKKPSNHDPADIEAQRYDPKEDLALYRTIHTRRCERETRMAARNELIKLSLMEKNNQIDSSYLSQPSVVTCALLGLFILLAVVANASWRPARAVSAVNPLPLGSDFAVSFLTFPTMRPVFGDKRNKFWFGNVQATGDSAFSKIK